MSVGWFRDNEKFYAMTTTSVSNVIETEFESGKTRTYLKNSKGHKAFTMSFRLLSKSEEQAFWTWYDDQLLSRSVTFTFTDFLGTGTIKTYRMTDEPSVPDSQYPKECQISVEEY